MTETVESKIKSIIDEMQGLTYIFDNWATANIKLDEEQFPIAINILPVSGKFNLGKMQLKDYPNCMIAFADKTEFDFDGVENDVIIERCKNLAKEFILRVNKSNLFEPIEGDIPYSVFYDKLDVCITGITIELQLKESRGLVLCYGKDIKEYFNGK